jgi:hypothetical protein
MECEGGRRGTNDPTSGYCDCTPGSGRPAPDSTGNTAHHRPPYINRPETQTPVWPRKPRSGPLSSRPVAWTAPSALPISGRRTGAGAVMHRTGSATGTAPFLPAGRCREGATLTAVSSRASASRIWTRGIRAFVKSERERWTCKTCGMTIDVHHYRCSACGKVPE